MFGKRNLLTKSFLGFQLVMACIFITTSVMFTQNTSYLNERPWGYNNRETLFADVPDQSGFEKLRDAMAQHPDVMMMAGGRDHVGKSHQTAVIHVADREYEVDQLAVDPAYFETMGIQLRQGRLFQDHDNSDRQAAVVNEFFVKTLSQSGWDQPLGQTFVLDSVQYEVVGVVHDFHNYSFAKNVRPMVFTVSPKEAHRFLAIRSRADGQLKTYRALQEQWAKIFPEIPFTGGFQEDVWGRYYQDIGIYSLVWKVFAFLAIALVILGLYGLVRLNVEGRTKEFSIRKILGAGRDNIAVTVFRPFFVLFVLGITIGGTLGYLWSSMIIKASYAYHMPMGYSGALIAVAMMVVMMVGTIATQIFKVMKANPVTGLKTE